MSPHKEAASQHAVNMHLHSRQSRRKRLFVCEKGCWWGIKGKNRSFWNITWPWQHFRAPLPDSHSHIPPPLSFHSFLDFLRSSPLCPGVISLMMCNALKVLHQPDLLKWSMGNAPGVTFLHTPSLLPLSVSCLSPAIISAVRPLSPASFSPICLLKLSWPITSTLSLPFSLSLFLSLSLSPPLWRLN